MSVKRPAQKNTWFSLKPGLFRCEQASSVANREFTSDESDCDNVAFHRPKCPWSRRRSYLQKIRKTTIYDSSLTLIPEWSESHDTKKPWLHSSISNKNNEFWQRPLGKKKRGVHCFCTRQEQAKVTPPSRKLCSPDWIATRRNHIVNKFDGFSKNILKITGKLSQETISMITSKIKENLEKRSDFKLQNIYHPSIKLTGNNPYAKIEETNRILQRPSKTLPKASCIKMSLMSSEMNIFSNKKYSFCNKRIPVNKENYVSNTGASVINSIEVKLQSTNEKNTIVGERRNAFYRSMFKGEKIVRINGEDPTENVKNDSENCKVLPVGEKYSSRNKSIFVHKNNKNLDKNELFTPSCNRLTLARDRNSPICEESSLTSDKISLIDKQTPEMNKNSRLVDRPASVNCNFSYLTERPASANIKASYLTERPASANIKASYLTDRPSSVSNNLSYLTERPASANIKASYFTERPVSASSNASYLSERPISVGNKIYLLERPKSVGDKSFTNSEKPKSRGDKSSHIFQRPTSGGNLYLRERTDPFGKNSDVGDNASTIERSRSVRNKTSQLYQNTWSGHKPSQFYARSVAIRSSLNIGDNASTNNDKPSSAGDKIFRSSNCPPSKNAFLHIYKTNESVGDSTFVDNNLAGCNEIPMSNSNEILQSISSVSSKNKTSLFPDKCAPFGENIDISGNAPSYNENTVSPGDETPLPICSLSPEIETPPTHKKYVSFGNSTYVGHDACDINEKPSSASKKPAKPIEKFPTRNKLSHFHAGTISVSNSNVYVDDRPLSARDKSSLIEVSLEPSDDKNLGFYERPTLAYQRKKQDRSLGSKVNVIKSSLDIVKSLQPVLNKNLTSLPSKSSLGLSARRKILLERNVKKQCVEPNDGPTGYTVQLVRLKNYHRIEDPKKRTYVAL